MNQAEETMKAMTKVRGVRGKERGSVSQGAEEMGVGEGGWRNSWKTTSATGSL